MNSKQMGTAAIGPSRDCSCECRQAVLPILIVGPQTVLKTAGLPSTYVPRGLLQFDRGPSDSRIVRPCPPAFAELAVILAVGDRIARESQSQVSGFDSLREHQPAADVRRYGLRKSVKLHLNWEKL
jgi:hypothetical protein